MKDNYTIFNEYTNETQRNYLIKAFDDVSGLKFLSDSGWEITNHSKSHYPVGEETAIHRFNDEFQLCEKEIQKIIGNPTKSWVIPFERKSKNSSQLIETFHRYARNNRYLGLVESRPTSIYDIEQKIIYRIYVPDISGKELVDYIKSL